MKLKHTFFSRQTVGTWARQMDGWQISLQVKWGVWRWGWIGTEERAFQQRDMSLSLTWTHYKYTKSLLFCFFYYKLTKWFNHKGRFISKKDMKVKKKKKKSALWQWPNVCQWIIYAGTLWSAAATESSAYLLRQRCRKPSSLFDDPCTLAYVVWPQLALYLMSNLFHRLHTVERTSRLEGR